MTSKSETVKRYRTPKYRPEFCECVVPILKNGKNVEHVAAYLEVAECTIYAWRNKYPEFREVFEIGLAASKAWWSDSMQNNLENRDANVGLYSLIMRNKFKWLTRDPVETETVSAAVDPDLAAARDIVAKNRESIEKN